MLREHQKLIIASHNAGKVLEMSTLLAPWALRVVSAGDLGLEEPEENGHDFTENALIKARCAAQAGGRDALADDSGLEVIALDRAPGIYSARWAGKNRDFAAAMRKIHTRLEGHDDRRARFVCALALVTTSGEEHTFVGTCDGTLTWPARGARGFGYDPIFVPRGHRSTFAEMAPTEKHAISHRMAAFRAFADACLPKRRFMHRPQKNP